MGHRGRPQVDDEEEDGEDEEEEDGGGDRDVDGNDDGSDGEAEHPQLGSGTNHIPRRHSLPPIR